MNKQSITIKKWRKKGVNSNLSENENNNLRRFQQKKQVQTNLKIKNTICSTSLMLTQFQSINLRNKARYKLRQVEVEQLLKCSTQKQQIIQQEFLERSKKFVKESKQEVCCLLKDSRDMQLNSFTPSFQHNQKFKHQFVVYHSTSQSNQCLDQTNPIIGISTCCSTQEGGYSVNFQENYEQTSKKSSDVGSQQHHSRSSCKNCVINNLQSNKQELEQKSQLINYLCNVKQSELTCLFHKNQKLIEEKLNENNYFISHYLTSGGEGIIFEGYSNQFSKEVEVVIFKFIFPSKKEDFENEVSILKLFEKRINVIEYKDSLEILKDEIYVIVLEKCEKSLRAELDTMQSFSLTKLLQIVFDLLDGLIQFRIYNILHLDIKPGNILISKKGVYLYTDFGISSVKKLQIPIQIKGYTQSYASFEQLQNDPNINFNSDVYSLGKTFEDLIRKYKDINDNESNSFVQFLEQTVKDFMINNQKEKRKDCLNLHCMIYERILSSEYESFLKIYSVNVKEILLLDQFDKNKDIPYFSQLKMHYQFVQLKAQKIIFRDNPNEEISLTLQEIGKNYCQLGEPQNALIFEKESLDLRRSLKGGSKKVLANLLNSIGCTYLRIGDFKNSLKYLEEALDMERYLYSEANFETAKTLNNIACNYKQLGQFDLSLKYMLESYEIRKKLFKYDHPSIVLILRSIGIHYYMVGDFKNTEKYLFEQYRISKQLYIEKKDHPQFAQGLSCLSLHQVSIGQYKEALKSQLYSIEIIKNIYQNNHSELSQSLNQASSYYAQLGDYQIALNYCQESINMQSFIFNEHFDNSIVAHTLSNLAKCLCGLGQYDMAQDRAFRSHQMRKLIFEGNHTDTADSLNDLACIQYSCNNLRKAIPLHLQSLDMQKDFFKKSHPKIAKSLFEIGKSYRKQGDFFIALLYFKESLQIRQDILTSLHPDIEDTLFQIGCCCRELGQNLQAVVFFKKCLEKLNQNYNKNDPKIEQVLEIIGILYSELGEYKNAIKYKFKVFEIRQCLYIRDHSLIAQSLNDIGSMYLYLGYIQRSLKYKCKSLQMYYSLNKKQQSFMDSSVSFQNKFFTQLQQIKINNSHVINTEIRKIKELQKASAVEKIGDRYFKSRDLQKAIQSFQKALQIRFFHYVNVEEGLENVMGFIATLNKILDCF